MGSKVSKRNQFELKKHVNAIHCTNNLTLVQRKLFNALLYNAYPDLPNKACFQIQTKELCRLIGYNSNDYGKLKQALLGLITIAIEWNVIDCTTGKETKWKASSILSSAQLADGLCSYEYSQVMKELLYQPEIYGRIDIIIMAKFKSSYGLALYENCIRYQGLPQTPWFSLDIFRKLMGVLGEKYTAFKDFKKRVLNIAINEVNAMSPLFIAPEIERKNQQVVRIRFKLSRNLSLLSSVSSHSSETIDANLVMVLMDVFGFSEQLVSEVLEKYESIYIKEKVELILQSDSFISGKIRGVAGYLLNALKQDYKTNKSSQQILTMQRKGRSVETKLNQELDEQRQNQYQQYIQDKINNYLSSLSMNEHHLVIQDFEAFLKNENIVLQGWYKKYKFDHPGVKAILNHFIKKNKEIELGDILSYEEFLHTTT